MKQIKSSKYEEGAMETQSALNKNPSMQNDNNISSHLSKDDLNTSEKEVIEEDAFVVDKSDSLTTRDYSISLFNNIKDVVPKEKKLKFEEVLKYFNEVAKKQFNGKDKLEAMICGSFSTPQRASEYLVSRSIITYDIDNFKGNFDELLGLIKKSHIGNKTFIYYTTTSSTFAKPRIRLMLFISKDIEARNYNRISQNIAYELFLDELRDGVDKSSYSPMQLMFLPNRCNDEFKCGKNIGHIFDANEFLDGHFNEDVILPSNNETSEGNVKLELKDDLNSLSKELISYHKNLPLEITREKIDETLSNYNCNETDYYSWFTVCQALHHQFKGDREGLDIFINWSLTDDRYKEKEIRRECENKYYSLKKKTDNPVTFASVIKAVNEKKGLPSKGNVILNNEGTHEEKIVKSSLNPEIQQILEQIIQDQFETDVETGEQKQVLVDVLKYTKPIKKARRSLVLKNIALDKKKDPNFIALNNIYPAIREYNNLLSLDENESKPYTCEEFLKDIAKNTNQGLKTGFIGLDEHVTIQPSSLAFIAGRPSHGKTTLMLNILRNMLEDEDNKDKAFLFYSYEETRSDILIKIILSVANNERLDEQLKNSGVKGVNLRQRALNYFNKTEGKVHVLNSILDTAYEKVNSWIKEERLEILTPETTVESLSAAIIERCMFSQKEKQPNVQEQQTQQARVKKEVAAVFIDYVQKLSSEEERASRQQEIQTICKTLLSTALDKRVATSIILGAQANREVKSLDTLTLDNMRESGDIEQDANLVLGIWNERAAEIDWLLAKEVELKQIKKMLDLGLESSIKKKQKRDWSAEKIKIELSKIKNELDNIKNKPRNRIKVKILKNRNGQNNGTFELEGCLDSYFIEDTIETWEEKSLKEKTF